MSDDVGNKVHWSTVYIELIDGRLDNLARHLRETNGKIDPCVARRLASMLDPVSPREKFRLEVVRTKLGRPAKPLGQELEIAWFMAKCGAGEKGGYESALELTMTKFGLKSPTIIKAAWKRWKILLIRRKRALDKLSQAVQQQNSPDFFDPD